jgi:hypothetical protein
MKAVRANIEGFKYNWLNRVWRNKTVPCDQISYEIQQVAVDKLYGPVGLNLVNRHIYRQAIQFALGIHESR